MSEYKPNLTVVILVMVIATQIICIDAGWGYMQVYIASYLYSFNDSITTGKVHMLFTMMEVGRVFGA